MKTIRDINSLLAHTRTTSRAAGALIQLRLGHLEQVQTTFAHQQSQVDGTRIGYG